MAQVRIYLNMNNWIVLVLFQFMIWIYSKLNSKQIILFNIRIMSGVQKLFSKFKRVMFSISISPKCFFGMVNPFSFQYYTLDLPPFINWYIDIIGVLYIYINCKLYTNIKESLFFGKRLWYLNMVVFEYLYIYVIKYYVPHLYGINKNLFRTHQIIQVNKLLK